MFFGELYVKRELKKKEKKKRENSSTEQANNILESTTHLDSQT